MKSIFLNKICALIISLVLMMLSDNISAQFHYSPPPPSFSSNNDMLRFMAGNRAYNGVVNSLHKFRIMFNDGTETLTTGRMKKDSSSYYLLVENKAFAKRDSARYQKIRPSKTEYIFRTDSREGGEYKGTATDSCWLFEKIEGAVNAYTPLPEDYIADSSITYLQKGDTAPLIKMSEENIADVLAGDAKALKLVKKKKYIKAILKYNDDTINKLN